MAKAGRPSVQRNAVSDAVESAIVANGGDLLELLAAEFKPLYYQTLARALTAEDLVGRCFDALTAAAGRGDTEPAKLILNELVGAGYEVKPRRWWRAWRR